VEGQGLHLVPGGSQGRGKMPELARKVLVNEQNVHAVGGLSDELGGKSLTAAGIQSLLFDLLRERQPTRVADWRRGAGSIRYRGAEKAGMKFHAEISGRGDS